MNDAVPPLFTGTSVKLPITGTPNLEPPVHLPRLLLGLALTVATFDLCFWGVNSMGFSVAVFFLVLAGIILTNRESSGRKRMTTGLVVALLLGAAFATILETGFTNTCVLLLLTVALAGETYYGDITIIWGRWLSQVISIIAAPGRLIWLSTRLMQAAFAKGLGWTGGIIGGCLLAIPALVLALIFGSLLATGNAVFGSWAGSFFDWLEKELTLYLDPSRIFLWLFVAFVSLPLLRPAHIPAFWWRWTGLVPRLPKLIPSNAALFSSVLTLAVLNLLFLVANVADARFLWTGENLPAGVTYKSYVHEGVNSLIATVILTAVVLTAIFQQELNVAKRKELKALALFWIVQNLFLLASVALRIKYYIVAFEMTVARLGVIIFLILVAAGFILLTIKILKEKSLSWLVGGCVIAVFCSFYITQFLDLSGWSANYNIAQWEKDRSKTLDFWHLYEYGPDAWPALRRAHDIDPSIAVLNEDANKGYLTRDTIFLAQFDSQHWREFSLRACMNRGALEDKK